MWALYFLADLPQKGENILIRNISTICTLQQLTDEHKMLERMNDCFNFLKGIVHPKMIIANPNVSFEWVKHSVQPVVSDS